MITAIARHQRILKLLRDHGSVRLARLQREVGMTPMTLWRDLKYLEEQGLLRRVRGGAESLGTAMAEPNFEAKLEASDLAKRKIAALSVKLFVNEGEVIALEGGTTVAALVDELPLRQVSVITNSLPVGLYLRGRRPALPVQVIGGCLSSVSGNTTGPEALKAIARQRSSVCFISASGWDTEKGPLDPNPMEIEAKRMLAAQAARVVLLMDASKFSKTAPCVTLHVKRLHALVTDKRPPLSVIRQLEKAGVALYVADGASNPRPLT